MGGTYTGTINTPLTKVGGAEICPPLCNGITEVLDCRLPLLPLGKYPLGLVPPLLAQRIWEVPPDNENAVISFWVAAQI